MVYIVLASMLLVFTGRRMMRSAENNTASLGQAKWAHLSTRHIKLMSFSRRCRMDIDMWMTLPSRQRIRNSSPGGLRPSTLPLGDGSPPPPPHNTKSVQVSGKDTFVNPNARAVDEPALSDFLSRHL